ncbi:MAG: hypothetical protein WCK09_15350 [Bacteroidota bacterium]|jgi:hypothetical protein
MATKIIMIQVDAPDQSEVAKVTRAIQMLATKIGNKKLIKLAEKVEKNPALVSTALNYI